MAANSILSNLDKADIVSEITLILGADYEHLRCIALVEGEYDILFFSDKLSEKVDLISSFGGKPGVIDIVEQFDSSRVIGICDADYGPKSSRENIFYYDTSCLEMMLASNDNVFNKISSIYYHDIKSIAQLKEKIFEGLKFWSLLRKYNSYCRAGINFDGVRINKIYDRSHNQISDELLLKSLKTLNPSKENEIDQISSFAYEELPSVASNSSSNIIQGHDFVFYFKFLCEQVQRKGIKSPNQQEIERCLIGIYSFGDFTKSELYSTLKKYANDNCLDLFA